MTMGDEMKRTANPAVYRKAHKNKKGEFSCVYCPPNRGENATPLPRHISWKDKGKTKHGVNTK